jgi:transcriptional regulator with XRE-family HTH domain
MNDLPSLLTRLRGPLSGAELAHKAGVSERMIRFYEAGDYLPSGRLLVALIRGAKPSADLREEVMTAWTAAKSAANERRAEGRRAKREGVA